MQLAFLGAIAAAGGCSETPPWLWTTFLDPTKMSAGYNRQTISQIQRSLSFEDTPPGVPGAEEPTVEDAVAVFEDYRLGVGDQIEVRIRNFMERGFETVLQLVLSDVGEVQVPQLGWVNVEGLTAKEVEQELRDRAVQQGLFTEENAPPFQVTILSQRQRIFNISGAILNPGPYRILEPDFRLIDALSLAGGVPEQADWIYVYRSQKRPRRSLASAPAGAATQPTTERVTVPDRGPDAPPVTPTVMASFSPGGSTALAQNSPAPTTDIAERDLIDAIAPARPPSSTAATTPAPSEQTEAPAPSTPKFIYLNGEWVDVSEKREGAAAPPATAPDAASATTAPKARPAATEPVTWESVAAEDRQRVIQIPADALRRGEARYNIVIRHRDLVRVDPGPQGEFFMFGNVARPGAYTLTGRDVTLKQAIASAGGLDLLAWPSRCEIVRRLDQDREQIIPVNLEQIFMGNQDDVYLRPGDIVNVGTNFIAPFLATVRSSFRMSYGFGFVYDRNYGDIDSYGPKENPESVRRQERNFRRSTLFAQ